MGSTIDQVSGSHRPPKEFHKSKRQSIQQIQNIHKEGIYVLRDHVPFDRWFASVDPNQKLETISETWAARFSAVKTLAHSVLVSVWTTVKYVASFVFSTCYGKDLSEQWQGVYFSGVAIASPNAAKKMFFDHWAKFENWGNQLNTVRAVKDPIF